MAALQPDFFNKVYTALKECSVSDTPSLTAVSSLPRVLAVFYLSFIIAAIFLYRKKERGMKQLCSEAADSGNRLPLSLVNFFKFSLKFIYPFLLGTST